MTRLSIVLTGDQPPNEFRVFTAGKVDTSKGEFLFDDESAASVMADYAKQGNELMVDYDHASLAGLSIDPAQAGKSAGWFNLEVRNGELWAVNVRWTPPAHAALSAKEWRYMSPAFHADESGRITSLLNVALTNMPATRKLEPLMAASITALGDTAMTLEEFMKVCKALGLDMSMSLDEAMAKIKGEAPAEEKKDDPAPAEPVAAADPAAAPAKPEEDKPAEVAAALSAICSLSGKAFVASVADIRTWHASHVELATERKKLADREAVLEGAERVKLCRERVTLAGKSPSEVWADPLAAVPTPKAYLLSMPIADLRAMCADEIKAKGGKTVALNAPASSGGSESGAGSKTFVVDGGKSYTLSALDMKYAADANCDPQIYATLKARREASVKA